MPLAYADNPNDSDFEGLLEYITGPDFPQAVLFTVNQVLLMPTVPVKRYQAINIRKIPFRRR